jgi:hypothetical protein
LSDDQQQLGQYDLMKCPTCAKPWQDHTPDCPRHPYRPERFRTYDRPALPEIGPSANGVHP